MGIIALLSFNVLLCAESKDWVNNHMHVDPLKPEENIPEQASRATDDSLKMLAVYFEEDMRVSAFIVAGLARHLCTKNPTQFSPLRMYR